MNTGQLYIVGTPIGNMDDITYRAIDVLKNEADYILCEDTRQTGKLLSHFDISKKLSSFHAHSTDAKLEAIIKDLKDGKKICYLSDAGTPAISDPGGKLVSHAALEGIKITPIPGVSALTTLVSVTGFPAKEVTFSGFVSKKPGKRLKELEILKKFDGIIVIFESPYRIEKLLHAIAEIFPEHEIVIGREMTKVYEEYIRGTIEDIIKNFETLKIKGEFSVAINNRS